MFTITAEQRYEFPVEVKLPNPRIPGQFVTHRFIAIFEALPLSESRALVREVDEARARGDAMDLDKEMLRRVVVGWSGVEEPFDAETLERAIDSPWICAALMDAYKKSVSGEAVQARRRGN